MIPVQLPQLTVMQRHFFLYLCTLSFFIALPPACPAQNILVKNNAKEKKIVFGTEKLRLTLDYNKKAAVTEMLLNGQSVITDQQGIYAAISTKKASYSTLQLLLDPVLQVAGNKITLSGISYGDNAVAILETWIFSVGATGIKFNIERTVSKEILVEKAALPVFVFSNMETWEGACQDYGGLAWFYLFNKPLDTYGVYSRSSQFWNSKTGNGLMIAVDAPGNEVAMNYNRTKKDQLAYTIAIAQKEMLPRYDSGTHRRLFIRYGDSIWAPFTLPAGKTSNSIYLSYFDSHKAFDRGKMQGVNAEQVNGVLNTIARIGVIGKQHFGANSWHTPYGPICMHEQYIAQIGLAVNDSNYLKGYSQCLDFYRDNAIKPNGRVWGRWAYTNEDMMPGEVTDKGFYEAQWGYLLDANPDYVSNVAELYDQTGDLHWVKRQQLSCEKALEWIMKRDSNGNGLVEMVTDSHTQKKGSDWIDIIWASYENAFVNAKLYHALVLWAAIEKQLGDAGKAKYFAGFAEKLKTSFNKNTAAGGFWDDDKKCYIHWRDKDNSIHGNNMVTPVNFMAIAYGICDDEARKKTILDAIEVQMQQENLFFWPLCMYSYNPGEGNDWQFPFPNYENGDIFLSWGSIAVNAYASYKPALALKYVRNVLARYGKDGLAFQRYGRVKQDGLGDDILSGNSLSVVGLYQAIYGINPLYNRFFLDPHITPELAGTQLKYNYRQQQLLIDLDTGRFAVSSDQFTISSPARFGFFSNKNSLWYFNDNEASASLTVKKYSPGSLVLDMESWSIEKMVWQQSPRSRTAGKLAYIIAHLLPNSYYSIFKNGKLLTRLKSSMTGELRFANTGTTEKNSFVVVNK